MKKQDFKIDSVKTPHGSVPTVKGLENALNNVIDQVIPLAESFHSIEENVSQIQEMVLNVAQNVQNLTDNVAEIMLLLAKVNSTISDVFQFNQQEKSKDLQNQQANLIELQTILAKMMIQFEEGIKNLTNTPKKTK
ncbi:MAG: hypothetical protein HeimC3_02750 [Candidatus Heimdallarchaeota archaeon LC_3]|nr:MAG: hypothetical protein HeimC3_02750 [Candidatus Heimdallarchaeota archaeon LC_3]